MSVHVEPDLFGWMHQAARGDPASPAHVRLAYHLSTWGTREDPAYSNPRWPAWTCRPRGVRKPVVIRQIPLGNRGLPDTWGRYRDDRVE